MDKSKKYLTISFIVVLIAVIILVFHRYAPVERQTCDLAGQIEQPRYASPGNCPAVSTHF